MTVKEALISLLQLPSLGDDIIDKAIIDNELTATDAYSKSKSEDVRNCAIDVLQVARSLPDITEGGFSVKYNRGAIEARLLTLAKDAGRTDIVDDLQPDKPTITGVSPW